MRRLMWCGLALGLTACAEANPTLAVYPDAPVFPDADVDAPIVPDDATVPDAPTLDAPIDAPPDAGSDAVDASPDGPPDAAPDAPPVVLLPADICDTAIDITTQAKASGGYATEDTTVAFHNNAYAICGFSDYEGTDRVYRIDIAAGDILTVIATPLAPDPVDMAIALLQGCGASEACVRSADSGLEGDEETIVMVVPTTGTYYLYIDSYYANTSGAFSLNVILSTPPAP